MIDEAVLEAWDCNVREDCVFYKIQLLCSKTRRTCHHTVSIMSQQFCFWSMVKMTRTIDFYYSRNQSISKLSAKQCDVHDWWAWLILLQWESIRFKCLPWNNAIMWMWRRNLKRFARASDMNYCNTIANTLSIISVTRKTRWVANRSHPHPSHHVAS